MGHYQERLEDDHYGSRRRKDQDQDQDVRPAKSSNNYGFSRKQAPLGSSASFHYSINPTRYGYNTNYNDNSDILNANHHHHQQQHHQQQHHHHHHHHDAKPHHVANQNSTNMVSRCYSDISTITSTWGGNMLEETPKQHHNHYNPNTGEYTLQDLDSSFTSHPSMNGVSATASSSPGPVFSSNSTNCGNGWGGVRLDPEVKRRSRLVSYKAIALETKMKASMRKSFRWIKDKYLDTFHGTTKVNALASSDCSP